MKTPLNGMLYQQMTKINSKLNLNSAFTTRCAVGLKSENVNRLQCNQANCFMFWKFVRMNSLWSMYIHEMPYTPLQCVFEYFNINKFWCNLFDFMPNFVLRMYECECMSVDTGFRFKKIQSTRSNVYSIYTHTHISITCIATVAAAATPYTRTHSGSSSYLWYYVLWQFNRPCRKVKVYFNGAKISI